VRSGGTLSDLPDRQSTDKCRAALTVGVDGSSVDWLAGRGKLGGQVRLRPDHKLAIVRDMDVATRLRGAREVLGNLTRIVGQAKAA
jgi:hypothetical protein